MTTTAAALRDAAMVAFLAATVLAGPAHAAPAPMCKATDFEKVTLFVPPKGMTLVSDVIGYFRQETPFPGVPFRAAPMRSDARRMAYVASTMLLGGRGAQQKIFQEDWGFVLDCDRIHGLTFSKVPRWPNSRRSIHVGVVSCALCHTGRVAGRPWEGLGNKRIDVFMVGRDGSALQGKLVAARNLNPMRSTMAREIDENALAFTRRLADPSMTNRTVGLIPDAHVTWWIYQVTGGGQPANAPRGEMKIPSLWNMKWRRGKCDGDRCEVGLFVDAFGTGRGWLGGAVLGADQYKEVVASPDYQALVSKAEDVLLALPPPPPYPCPIDAQLAERGRTLFQEKHCAKCHELDPDVPPHTVAIEKIGTDPDRLLLLGKPPGSDGVYGAETRRRMDLLQSQVARFERARYQQLDADGSTVHGYIAPRLEGVWARFPYLHNGSVPTLDDLLSAPEDRPTEFDLTLVETRECFDPARGGLLDSPECKPNLRNWSRPADPEHFETRPQFRNIYDTRQSGHRNIGHEFWRDETTGQWTLDAETRKALIEYLKTLGGTELDASWCPAQLALP